MSTVQEVQQALLGMSSTDRSRVSAFLLHLSHANDPAHKTEMAKRLQRMREGGGVAQEEVEQRV
jgi:phosphoribosyl 1,2-cyclic phosphodiesterase